MRKILALAIAAIAAAPLASAAPVTMSVDLAAGTKATVTVSQTVADSLVLAGEIPAGLEVAKAVTVLAEAKARADKATAEAKKREAAKLVAKADSLQKAAGETLRPMTKVQCLDWAYNQADSELAFEALRVRWTVAPFPEAVEASSGAKCMWLLGGSGGGGSSARVDKLRRETEAAFHAVKSEISGVRKTLTDKAVVSEEEVVAAVNKLLSQDKFTLGGGEATPAPPDEGGVKVVVLPAGD